MKIRLRTISVLSLLVLLVVGTTGGIFAADYPTRPVTLIVAYSPGGGTDVVARTVAHFAERYLNQSIVVENRPGAAGQIGFTAVAKARPDGYTIGFVNVPVLNLLPAIRPDCTYSVSDFKFICNVVLDPLVLAVRADSPFETLADFLDYARQNPSGIVIGVDGPQSNNQLQGIVMGQITDTEFTFVMYDGAAPALTATLGGHVDATIPSAGEAVPFVEEGQLRILAVFWPDRFPFLPDAPTFEELTGIEIPPVGASARGLAAPKNVPAERLRVLEEAFEKAVNDPEFQAKAEEMALPILYMDSREFEEHIKATEIELQRYVDLL